MTSRLSWRQVWVTMAVWAISAVGWAETGVTNLVDGTTANYTSGLTIGTNGSFNVLIVTNSGAAIVTGGDSIVGNSANANSNSVFVTGTGSLWTNSANLYVGNTGSFNNLTISNGGRVANDSVGYIGAAAGANSNSVLVTGPNSSWYSNGGMLVGSNGSFNSLTVVNGGAVSNFYGGINIGYEVSSCNNSVLVTGPGSMAYGFNDIGYFGSGNSLVITNGGSATGGFHIGYASSSCNNSVLVTGAGSVWNSYDLSVGYSGSGNSLTITNGGHVINIGPGYIGQDAGANNNWVLVTGAGSLWTNSYDLSVGYNGSSNRLTIANGGVVKSGAYYLGAMPPSIDSVIGRNDTANNNSVLVTGAGSFWGCGGDLCVGMGNNSGNSLTIANGGQVVNTNGFIGGGGDGFSPNTRSNSVLVTGTGSLWTNNGDLFVGEYGFNNRLTIANGGRVVDRYSFIEDGNSVLVTGIGSVWTNSYDLVVGLSSNSSLTIAAGGLVVNGDGYIGSSASLGTPSNSTVTVTDAGSRWINRGNLSVGASEFSSGWPAQLSIGAGSLVTVGTNYTQYANSTLCIGISGTNSGQYGQLQVGGNAALDGALQVMPVNGQLVGGSQVIILTATGSVSGAFSSFTYSSNTALRAHLIYDSSDVQVVWDQLSFSGFALTPNQRAVAGALNSASGNPRATPLIGFLDSLSTNQLPGAFDMISPAQLTSIFSLGFAGANVQGWNLLNRVHELRSGMGGFSAGSFGLFDPTGKMNDLPQFAANNMDPAQQLAMSQGAMARSKENPWGVFVSGAGEFAGVQGTAEASGYHLTTAGMTVGADYRFNDQFVLGVAMGYGSTYAGLASDGRVDVDSARGNLYGVWFNEGWHVEGSVGGGYNIYDTKRATIGGAAKADATGTELEGMLGTGYDWQHGPWTFGPYATLQYTTLGINSFTEKGSLAPLRIASQDQDSLHSLFGAHLGYKTKAGSVELMPDIHAGWQHEFFSQSYALDSRFASGAGDTFRVNGPEIGRESAVVGCGLSVKWSETISTYVNYNTELGRSNYAMQSVTAGIRLAF